jgi:hypothetical protein
MQIKMKDAPPLAVEFMNFLARKYGICGEICMTAYAVYAQIVEECVCRDDLYWPDLEAMRFFAERGHKYTDVTRRQPNAIGATV